MTFRPIKSTAILTQSAFPLQVSRNYCCLKIGNKYLHGDGDVAVKVIKLFSDADGGFIDFANFVDHHIVYDALYCHANLGRPLAEFARLLYRLIR